MSTLATNQVYKAYRSAAHTVPKTQQIVMMYDGAIRFMLQAREAMEQGDVETRYNRLVRVGEIVMGLQSSLDFEVGGDVASILYDFYSSIDMRVMTLHHNNDIPQYESIVADLRDMRNVWATIGADYDAGQAGKAPPVAPSGNDSVSA